MEITILIVSYKTRLLLGHCLRGIYEHPPKVSFEVIVVDNGSADGTVEMIKEKFPKVRLIALPNNLGYSAGSNKGIEAAEGRFIFFLNADIVTLDNSFDRLYDYMIANQKVGIVGPQLLNPDRSIQYTAYRWYRFFTPFARRSFLKKTNWGRSELKRFLILDWDHNTERSVEWLMSSCFLVRREALVAIRFFDTRFFVYLADTDLCRRIWQAGWSVRYLPRAKFVHYYRRESAESLTLAYIHFIDWMRYLWKWRGQKPPIAKD